ncbi:hypothetical protein CHS0354_023820 [Potamilus streckersoni]|uniref:Pyruvate carboxylase n=1 Tax=Potamilus streckersoni TaxID=2493646 RepID=A0AAE0RZ53_9BIVA|nr:hypothetical protein CHS0354_023820 [Potamilus streckersoni]
MNGVLMNSKAKKERIKKITRLLVANRGEIAIRVMRAADELGIKTIAVYSHEDRYSLHRFKSDEAYQIGGEGEAVKPYLNIEEIIQLAKKKNVDAIHPGYGFLSENVEMASRCREENIIWVGPSPEAMKALGDKVAGKKIAREAQVPVIEDFQFNASTSIDLILGEIKKISLPVIIKASAGGGGRGMRVIRNEQDVRKSIDEATREAKNAFGDDTIFIEKYIDSPKHVEVQLLGDLHGNLIHLLERDCSVQRRFQKVVEVAPAISLKQETKNKLYDYALKIGRAVNYSNAGTVEFLIDQHERIYFIEVNPRIQVEHTITEEITGIDIVRSQVLIAQGFKLSDDGIRIFSQDDVNSQGRCAIQCRITTEDPQDNFKPDFGTILAYRNAGGYGLRLDEGSSYTGMKISPYFDSLLVKVTARGRSLKTAAQRLERALREFRIRGVKTNIGFLINVIRDPVFLKGEATVSFIEARSEKLFQFRITGDRSTKMLSYLGDVIVNGHPEIGKRTISDWRKPVIPIANTSQPFPKGSKNYLDEHGPKKLSEQLRQQKQIAYTDTTMRDAHQSLLATRVRTIDMLAVAESFARQHPEVFSMEVWGGATFDVAMRFLQECPWNRLKEIRRRVPNILLQMLFRGANAVGYSNYPKNLVEKFVEKSAKAGIDIFRIFDSLNWVESMKPAIKAVIERTNSIAEATLCYTGDVLTSKKYTLQYYLDLARELEDTGAHTIAVKDMAGLLKPRAAEVLICQLRKVVALPVRLHTHDTSSIQAATYLKAIDAGVDSIDVALGGLSGLTSQPNFNSIVAMMQGHEREQPINLETLNEHSNYWEDVREYYAPFESGLKSGTAEVYDHEIPGGQYSNLRPQAKSLGLLGRFEELKKYYIIANRLFGDIIKVTPSSKVIGDMALFMLSNGLTEENIYELGKNLSFPSSVKGFFKGEIGQPYGGFPQKLQELILKSETPLSKGYHEVLQPIDFEDDIKRFKTEFKNNQGELEYLSYKMYPQVYKEFYERRELFGDLWMVQTPIFFYGLESNQEVTIEIGEGKQIVVKYLFHTKPDDLGMSTVSFELNGQSRRVKVRAKEAKVVVKQNKKVSGMLEVGSPLQGRISKVMVKASEKIHKGQPLFVIEAMKMESIVESTRECVIDKILLSEGTAVEQSDAVITFAS